MTDQFKQQVEFGKTVGAFYLGLRMAGVDQGDATGIIVAWMKMAAVKLPTQSVDDIVKKLIEGQK